MKLKNVIIYISTIILTIVFIVVGFKSFTYDAQKTESNVFLSAKVVKIEDRNVTKHPGYEITELKFKAIIKNGEYKDQVFTMSQTIDGMYIPKVKEVQKGDNIIATYLYDEDAQEVSWHFSGYNRLSGIILLVAFFFVLILLIGRKKGFNTILSLIFTVGIIVFVYIPSILSGFNIYISTIMVSVVIILMSLTLLNGLNKKTFCAIVGNFGGLAVAGVVSTICNNMMKMTGMVDEDYAFLTMLGNGVSLDLKAIVWGGILIGSLGAVMDVAMSISSSMKELSDTMENKSFYRMVKSGMNIGTDAIGTMTNTLILAYVGSSIAIMLLFAANSKDMLYLFNTEMIAAEIIQAIAGSIGILISVPITVFFAAWIFNKKDKTKYINVPQNIDTNK